MVRKERTPAPLLPLDVHQLPLASYIVARALHAHTHHTHITHKIPFARSSSPSPPLEESASSLRRESFSRLPRRPPSILLPSSRSRQVESTSSCRLSPSATRATTLTPLQALRPPPQRTLTPPKSALTRRRPQLLPALLPICLTLTRRTMDLPPPTRRPLRPLQSINRQRPKSRSPSASTPNSLRQLQQISFPSPSSSTLSSGISMRS
jgi:hypothetical protein